MRQVKYDDVVIMTVYGMLMMTMMMTTITAWFILQCSVEFSVNYLPPALDSSYCPFDNDSALSELKIMNHKTVPLKEG
jgi:hypothetical protein